MEEKLKLPIVKVTVDNYYKLMTEIKNNLSLIGITFNFYYYASNNKNIMIGLTNINCIFYLKELPINYNSEDYYLCNDIDEFCEYVYKYITNYYDFKRKQEIECHQTYYYFYITIRTQYLYKTIYQKNLENKVNVKRIYEAYPNEGVVIIYSQQITEEEFNYFTKQENTNNHEQD